MATVRRHCRKPKTKEAELLIEDYTNLHLNPPLDDWAAKLKMHALDSQRLTALRTAARRRLVESAQQFVMRLATVVEEADVGEVAAPVLTGDSGEQPIVMTGHQPVVFHSGLTFKYEVTEQFATEHNAIAIAVVIDTDRGDAGQFSFPQPDNNHPAMPGILAIESLADSHNVYSQGKLKTAAELRELSGNLSDQLREQGQEAAADKVANVLSFYAQLRSATSSAMEANLIGRWRNNIGSRMLELPLSAVSAFPEVLTLIADILKQPRRFAAAYNSALEVFREEHNIRNPANPFPSLRTEGETCELPFWVINHNSGERQVLEVCLDDNVTHLIAGESIIDTFAGNITAEALEPMMLQNLQVVPRGALITAFLRLLFADLFVHGTGGGRYDAFTDEFVRTWWSEEPTPFTVASASRYLFEDQRAEVLRLEGIQGSLRDLQFNPQRHLGTGAFSASLEEQLQELLLEKVAAVSDLKEAREKEESGRDFGVRIQEITTKIKEAVDAEFEPQLKFLRDLSPEQLDAINCRTYPWFFFEPGHPG